MHQIVLSIHLNSSLKCLFGMLNAFRDDKINKFKDSEPHSWSRSYKIYLVVKKNEILRNVLVNLKFFHYLQFKIEVMPVQIEH